MRDYFSATKRLAVFTPEQSPLQKLEGIGPAAGFSALPLTEITANIIAALLSIIGLVLLALIVYGGVIWMKARGNEKESERAKNILTDSIIGLVIVLLAYALSRFVVCSLLQATGAALC